MLANGNHPSPRPFANPPLPPYDTFATFATMGFLYSQLFKRPPYPTGSFAGKTVVISGSNTGLGKEAARHFARLGASRLILAVRSVDKGDAAKHDIETTTHCAKDVVQVWQLDMASYANVARFAARVDAELDRVDILLANAGVVRATYSTAEDNEEMVTVNVVSTFLLAALVMPKLRASAAKFDTRPTFTITTSGAHVFTQFPQKSAPDGQLFATLNDKATAERHWGDQYPVSKMLEIFGVRAIGEQSPAAVFPVTVNCVGPGFCHSELGRDYPTWGLWLMKLVLARDYPTWGLWLMKLVLARSTECGGRTLVHAGAQGADSHGQYLADCEIAPAPVVTSRDGKAVQDRVWAELVEKLEAIKPGVTSNFLPSG